jgi:orotidine-5'-phosphate decarboxylase
LFINPDQIKSKIVVALDVDSKDDALKLVHELKGHVGLFKVGLELIYSEGIGIIQEINDLGGKVFLDCKFQDIPHTVAGASKAVTRLNVKMFNVHTMGGIEMMRAAVSAVDNESARLKIERPLILGVTVLTSVNQSTFNQELRIIGTIEEQVAHLATLAGEAGLDGVIASPHEIEAIRKVSKDLVIVTPGVRPTWAASQDQKRIMTPEEAVLRGASYLVIGRPITAPPVKIGTPSEAARKIVSDISNALERKEKKHADRKKTTTSFKFIRYRSHQVRCV